MKQSILVKVITTTGAEVTEYHTSKYGAEQGLAVILAKLERGGFEVKDYSIASEADRGQAQGTVLKCSPERYGTAE